MFLNSLQLDHFRNHPQKKWNFSHLTTLILGENARGKTAILEAINLLATGDSFRAETVPEMIEFGHEVARVSGVVSKTLSDGDEEPTHLEITLTRGLVQGKKTSLRLYTVNEVKRHKRDFTRYLTTVVFRPEDMRLIEGSPSRRRSFMDAPLILLDPEYQNALSLYERAWARRNKLLQLVRDGEQPANVLTFWNLTMIKHGEYLQKSRREFLDFCQTVPFPLHFSVEYQPSLISAQRLEEHQSREIAAGHTLIGPHKDDLVVNLTLADLQRSAPDPNQPSDWDWQAKVAQQQLNPPEQLTELPINAYGSRGQQRLAVLWLKLCEYEFLKTQTGQPPVLLLDDILSELDELSRSRVLDLIGQGQTVLTTTEAKLIDEIQSQIGIVQVITLNS